VEGARKDGLITLLALQRNVLEKAPWRLRGRLGQEVSRRASPLRLITAVALEVSARWAKRQYLDMTLLKDEEEKTRAKVA
jgi:hypothetical protein